MTRRQELTEAQLAVLFDPPAEQRDMVRHYTLSDCDMAMIRRCRGDHSRLGYALMLCFLRYPGRHLHAHEHPSTALISFGPEQIDVCADSLEDATLSEQMRRRHAAELQRWLRLRPFNAHHGAELAKWLLLHAVENDHAFGRTDLGRMPAAPDHHSFAAHAGAALRYGAISRPARARTLADERVVG